jgi:hypothetical protein
MEQDKGFKIIEKKVDESWKETVEKEKHKTEKPTEKPKSDTIEKPEEKTTKQQELDEHTTDLFAMLISSLATQALVFMGEMPIDEAGNRLRDVEKAKQMVDMLGMLKEKTEGNLTSQEAKAIEDVLYELRMRFVGVFK